MACGCARATCVRLALGIVSIGLDARANILANESSLTSGPLAYGYGPSRPWPRTSPPRSWRLWTGAGAQHERLDRVGVQPGRFGGGITLVESFDMSDGVLEVCRRPPAAISRPARARLRRRRAREGTPGYRGESARVVSFAAPGRCGRHGDGDRIASILHRRRRPRGRVRPGVRSVWASAPAQRSP